MSTTADRRGLRRRRRAFTLVELVLVVALIGVLASIGVSEYQKFIERARVASAIAEMQGIARVLDLLRVDGALLPPTLADLDSPSVDPWGRPYEYLKIEGTLAPGLSGVGSTLPHVGAGGGEARPRMDQFLVPINTDYDLYSRGADGETVKQLDRMVSRDDVIRAMNGGYFGLARDF